MNARPSIAAALLIFATSLCMADDGEGPWTVIDRDRGITVSRRVQPGCDLPAFRGQGRIHGNVVQLLAVILDLDGVDRWAHGVDESRPLRRIDARTQLVYLASDVPWPLRDRDMVVRAGVEVVRPGEEFRVSLRCEPDAQPEKSGVIRVKRCRSTLHIRKVDANTTDVDYVMTLDPWGAPARPGQRSG